MRSSPSIASTARRGNAAKWVMCQELALRRSSGKAVPTRSGADAVLPAYGARSGNGSQESISSDVRHCRIDPVERRAATRTRHAVETDRQPASPRPGWHRPRGGGPRRAGAQPAVDHRPGDRRPAAVRRPRRAGLQRRDLQLPRVARGDAGGRLRHQQRLRAAAASVAARGRRLRAASARHVRDRHP